MFGIAITQPIFDLLGQNPEFFVAHDISTASLGFFLVGFSVGIPLVAAAVVLLVRTASRTAGAALHLFFVGVLASVTILHIVARSLGSLPGLLLVIVALALGAGVAIYYRSNGTFRSALRFGAAIPLALVLWFILFTPSGDLLGHSVEDVEPASATRPAPIVYLILDELPVVTLLDAKGDIDGELFPNFARLAETSTWFRNATTVSERTAVAVPSALTGRLPKQRITSYLGHPENIFTLLDGSYDMVAAEPVTQLCPPKDCHVVQVIEPSLWNDAALLGAHAILPADLADGLPPVDEGWAGFSLDDDPGHSWRGEEFSEFIATIRRSDRPGLFVNHSVLPHGPFTFLPSGQRYVPEEHEPGEVTKAGFFGHVRTADEWLPTLGHQRHVLQTAYVDRMLGVLLDRLEETDLLEDSVVVVLADHGISFLPGQPKRAATADTVESIVHVPLFIKEPEQTEGRVSDAAVETIDVLPTIFELIGAENADFEGESAFGLTPDAERSFRSRRVSKPKTDWDDVLRANRARLIRLGVAPGDSLDPWEITPPGTGGLIGRSVESITATDESLQVTLLNPDDYERVDPDGQVVPAMLRGFVQPISDPADQVVVAVALNGRIAAVTRTHGQSEEGYFYAMLPPDMMVSGRNDVQILRVEEDGELLRIPFDG